MLFNRFNESLFFEIFSQESIKAQMQLMDAVKSQKRSQSNDSDAIAYESSSMKSSSDQVTPMMIDDSESIHISRDLKRKVELSMFENLAPLCGMRTALVRMKEDALT